MHLTEVYQFAELEAQKQKLRNEQQQQQQWRLYHGNNNNNNPDSSSMGSENNATRKQWIQQFLWLLLCTTFLTLHLYYFQAPVTNIDYVIENNSAN